jgi:hypothetical protein
MRENAGIESAVRPRYAGFADLTPIGAALAGILDEFTLALPA